MIEFIKKNKLVMGIITVTILITFMFFITNVLMKSEKNHDETQKRFNKAMQVDNS